MTSLVAKLKNLPVFSRDLTFSDRVLLLLAGATLVMLVFLMLLGAFVFEKDKVAYVYDLTHEKAGWLSQKVQLALHDYKVTHSPGAVKNTRGSNPVDYEIPRFPKGSEIFVGFHGTAPVVIFEGTASQFSEMPLKNAVDPFSETRVGKNAMVYCLTSFGTPVFTSNVSESDFKSLAARPAVKAYLSGSIGSGFVTFDVGSEKILGIYKEVPNSNLVLFMEIPFADAILPLRRYLLGALFLGFAIISIGVGYSAIALTRMWKPIYEIQRVTSQIAMGKFKFERTYTRKDEMGRIFNFLESMGGHLEKREKQIHEQRQALVEAEITRTRVEGELATAQAVQASLIQNVRELSSIPGIEVSAWYQAAEKIGGDWYGIQYDEVAGQTLFFIADVTGHGVGSALMTGVINGAVYGASASYGRMVSESAVPFTKLKNRLTLIQETANDVILQAGRNRLLLTMVSLGVEMSTGKMYYGNAGHTNPLVFKKNGKVIRSLGCTVSSPLGMAGFEEHGSNPVSEIDLEPGDLVFIYTDGLLENEGVLGERLSTRALRNTIVKNFHLKPAEICVKIRSAAERIWGSHPANDDVSFLVFRWEGPSVTGKIDAA